MKLKSVVVALLMFSAFPAVAQMVVVVKSNPVYDVNAVENRCEWNEHHQQQVCQAIAKPDRPFPLPIGFNTTVLLPNGEEAVIRTKYRYDRGGRVKLLD